MNFRRGLFFGVGVSVGAVLGMLGALEVVAWLDKRGLTWPPE